MTVVSNPNGFASCTNAAATSVAPTMTNAGSGAWTWTNNSMDP